MLRSKRSMNGCLLFACLFLGITLSGEWELARAASSANSANVASTTNAANATGVAEVSCACEDHSCKPCEIETNLTFYTAKCGPQNSRVKSCKRPTCVPVQDQKKCLAEIAASGAGGGDANTKVKTASKPEAVAGPVSGFESVTVRRPSSAKKEPAGIVTNAEAPAKVIRVSGESVEARPELSIFEGDTIETGSHGKVRIAFKDKNVFNVAPDSRVVIDLQEFSRTAGRRRTLLNLMYGRLRAKVSAENKYDGKENTFQVRTKSAVAGVRGTDFVASFEPGEKHWVAEIKTFEGKVEFGGNDIEDRVYVAQGQAASFSMEAPREGLTSAVALNSYIDKGVLSSVRAMTEDEIKSLDKETDYKDLKATQTASAASSRREPAAADDCTQPSGALHSCSYTCEGNPADEKTCRVDLDGVQCVRRICNANGEWARPTRMPRKYQSFCRPDRPMVRDCVDF